MYTVAAVQTQAQYPQEAPYHPSDAYAEYPFGEALAEKPNHAYAGVRRLLATLGLDGDHFETPQWNPLGFLIQPGMTVVLKPNFVLSAHKGGKDLFSIITHPSVLRAVADYCWIALKGEGKIIIADAPQYDCNFSELLAALQLESVVDFYARAGRGLLQVRDLRRYWSRGKHFSSLLEPLPGDPQGVMTVNLGKDSALYAKAHTEKLYGAVYHRSETIAHHHDDVHEYEVSRTIMDADVVISIPKLKVHKKVGVTLNVKGLVGMCTNKNYLVHYSITPPSRGGDQYPDGWFTPLGERIIALERWMYDHLLAPRKRWLEYLHRTVYWIHNHTTRRLGIKAGEGKRRLDAGNWWGNDSAWRLAADLIRVFTFADGKGEMQPTPQRRAFSIIDGIVGGENNGPLTPEPVAAGVLIGGENLLAVDLVATRLMGFDPLKLRMYLYVLENRRFDLGVRLLNDVQVLSEREDWRACLSDESSRFLNFKPHPGWVGHVEMDTCRES